MTKPLDGLAFRAYCRRLNCSVEAQDVLATIRGSPPTRRVRASAGNVPVSFPSTKMGLMIQAESHQVEFARLLELEHDEAVLEYYDQPPSIRLEYSDRHGQVRTPWHTADYFVYRFDSAGWEECKPLERLVQLAQKSPQRYVWDAASGRWRCPPGEAYAARLGLTYQLWVANDINWTMQSNWLSLEPYYQDLERLSVPEPVLRALYELVEATPGISLGELRRALQARTDVPAQVVRTCGLPADLINIAIAHQLVYVDLTTYRLSDQDRHPVPVYRDRHTAVAAHVSPKRDEEMSRDASPVVLETEAPVQWDGRTWHIKTVGTTEILLVDEQGTLFSLPAPAFEASVKAGKITGARWRERSSFTTAGAERLAHASPQARATANFRDRVIHPAQYADEEQVRNAAKRAAVPERTQRSWKQRYKHGVLAYGNGYIGLLPNYHACGRPAIAPEDEQLIHEAIERCYDTPARAPKRGAYGEYLIRSQEHHRPPVNQSTFYAHFQRHKTTYEQTVVREGVRCAYPFKAYHRADLRTLPRHGQSAWEQGYLDHVEVDVVLRDSETGAVLGKPWLTMLILGYPRRWAAYALSFDPPSYRSCLLALRLCVKRFGRLPESLTVDGGPEFHSLYFDEFIATFQLRKQRRPKAEPRFGSVQERLGLTLNTEFIDHLLGNTQATKDARTLTRATDPRRLSEWTLPALAEQVRQWADETYDTRVHPALKGLTPRQAYDQSIERDGLRAHKLIPYDEQFLRQTYPTTRTGMSTVKPGPGVRIDYIDYWCEEMRDADVEGTKVPVRYNPFDRSLAYAFIDHQWRECKAAEQEFVNCSERELQLMAEELRQSQRLQYGRSRIEIDQKHLAAFRRQNATKQALLAQQRKDRETKRAYGVLEGGPAAPTLQERLPSVGKVAAGIIEPAQTAPISPEPDLSSLLIFRRHQ